MSNLIDFPTPERGDSIPPSVRYLTKGGGGGDSGGMDPRIDILEKRTDRLEGKLDSISEDIAGLRADLAELKGKISMLPGYPGIAIIMTIIGGALLVVARLFPPA